MSNVLDVLVERGFVKQMSHEDEIRELLSKEKITFYIGFDATADSLHVGHYVQLMVMAHMQKHGHRPIALLGGGTTTIGDPSGKSDMRKMLTTEQITHNAECFKKQMSRFINFDGEGALMMNNADWLLELNYIWFLREIAVHFSVNRMLSAECYKSRYEQGLTMMEFNYMLMQSYDFLVLNQKCDAVLQMGGDDQWSNILAGADLIRRKLGKSAYAMTTALLATSEGKKMGKTEKGALWLDAEKTSPYDFYQYFRNVEDAGVETCLAMLTFLPMDEVKRLGALQDSEINQAKKILAFEVTKQVHGEEQALAAQTASEALFGGASDMSTIPTTRISQADFEADKRIASLLVLAGLAKSKGEARRVIEGGGVSVDDVKVEDAGQEATLEQVQAGILLKKGKKAFNRVVIG